MIDDSKALSFWLENSEVLLSHLAHHAGVGANEVLEALPEFLPRGADLDKLFLLLFGFRLTVEALEVEDHIGPRTANAVVMATRDFYSRHAPGSGGDLLELIGVGARAELDPGDRPEGLRRYCRRLLATADPDDELFHGVIIHVSNYGTTLAAEIRAGADPQ